MLVKYYQEELKSCSKDPRKVQKLMQVGEYKIDKLSFTSSAAAFMLTIQLIYNLEESIMRV